MDQQKRTNRAGNHCFFLNKQRQCVSLCQLTGEWLVKMGATKVPKSDG